MQRPPFLTVENVSKGLWLLLNVLSIRTQITSPSQLTTSLSTDQCVKYFRLTNNRDVIYLYTPDEIDRERAHHQAVIQGADDRNVKRIGNLGELAFEQFCREYLPVEMWEWQNEAGIKSDSYDYDELSFEHQF